MDHGSTIATAVLAAALCMATAGAQAFENSQYPNLKGQWTRVVGPNETGGVIPFDPSKPPGRGQQAPLTPEYQKIFEANLKEQEAGVPGSWPGPSCLPPGLPAQMTAYKTYRRSAEAHPQWPEPICVWESKTLRVGDEIYRIGEDGLLAPTKKDQEPPSLKYFPAQR